MSNERALTPRDVMEREKARLLEEAAAIDRDLAELDRLAAKYNLVVREANAPPSRTPSFQSEVLVKSPVSASGMTVADLVLRYCEHEDSPYRKVRHKTREHYQHLVRRIASDCGERALVDLKTQDIQELYKGWTDGRKRIGHSLVTMLRGLINFGVTVLKDADCERLQVVLHNMRFKVEYTAREPLTEHHARLLRAIAHQWGLHSIAMAQAFQFDCNFKQKDVIGEWVPLSEPGASDILSADGAEKWVRGLRWQHVDSNLVLRHAIGVQGKEVLIDLKQAPMVLEELRRFEERPRFGPLIVAETTGRPWQAMEFRRRWRLVANAAGIPKTIKNAGSHSADDGEKPRQRRSKASAGARQKADDD